MGGDAHRIARGCQLLLKSATDRQLLLTPTNSTMTNLTVLLVSRGWVGWIYFQRRCQQRQRGTGDSRGTRSRPGWITRTVRATYCRISARNLPPLAGATLKTNDINIRPCSRQIAAKTTCYAFHLMKNMRIHIIVDATRGGKRESARLRVVWLPMFLIECRMVLAFPSWFVAPTSRKSA